MLTILNIFLGLKLMTISADIYDLSTLSNLALFEDINMKQSLKLFRVVTTSLQCLIQIILVVSEINMANRFSSYKFLNIDRLCYIQYIL